MSLSVCIDSLDQDEWETYAKDFTDYSIYQTWAYQQVRCEMDGQKISRIVVKDGDGRVVTMCQLRIKQVRPLRLTVGYAQRGPLMCRRDGVTEGLGEAIVALRRSYLEGTVNVLRIVPNIADDEKGQEEVRILESCGLNRVASSPRYHTMVFPLFEDEQAMCSRFDRSWRRELKKAEQNRLEIKEGTSSEYFDILKRIYVSAIKRKGFRGLNPEIFVRTQKLLSPPEKMRVIVAYHGGMPISAHASSYLGFSGEGILAASTEKGLECGASYLVWWRALLSAKQSGMKVYDLGGIDPRRNPTVYQFKKRMGADECYFIGEFEAASNLFVKHIWRIAEKAYRFLKK